MKEFLKDVEVGFFADFLILLAAALRSPFTSLLAAPETLITALRFQKRVHDSTSSFVII
jgi:hypothetical protein